MDNNAKDSGFILSKAEDLKNHINDLRKTLKNFSSIEAALYELQAIISVLAEKAREAMALTQNGKYLWVNAALCGITGYNEDELLSLSMEELILPAYRNRYRAREAMHIAGDSIDLPEEWPLLRRDRTIRYVNVCSYRIIYKQKPALLIYYFDITAQKKLQNEMVMKSEILDSIGDSVLLAEISGKIIYVNEAQCMLTGYTKEELLNMHVLEFHAPEVHHQIEIRIKQFSEHKEARFNTVVVRKDGVRVHVEVRGKVIKQGGKPLLLGVAREAKMYDESSMVKVKVNGEGKNNGMANQGN